jgi:hypothetical protein
MKRVAGTLPVNVSIKFRINQILADCRLMTGLVRTTPDFIIIGAQRSGTTALYNTLAQHACIAPAIKKEVHFFDVNFKKGFSWYRAHFPSYAYKYVQKVRGRAFATGEASPYYIFHPHVPKRVSDLTPEVKLIALLRNPADRAYSHYHHEVRKGFETLSFENAIEKEKERLLAETPRMQADEDYFSFNHRHYSYLSRGIYVDQLKAWRRFFPKEQILVLKSEDFYSDLSSIIGQTLEFLKLPSGQLKDHGKYPVYPYSTMDAAVRKHLVEYFEPYNQKLYEYLGRNLNWN